MPRRPSEHSKEMDDEAKQRRHAAWLKEVYKLGPDERITLAQHLWNEYQHRHNLIWNLVFRLTAAVVVLGAIPYTQLEVMTWIGWWILAPPILGVALALFGWRRIRHELKMLDHVRLLYWDLQDSLFYEFYETEVRNTFSVYVQIYIVFLTALAVINILLIAACWLPNYLALLPERLFLCP
jgi:hypothetical protein